MTRLHCSSAAHGYPLDTLQLYSTCHSAGSADLPTIGGHISSAQTMCAVG